MNFEDFQKTWQHQGDTPKIAINADLLLKEIRRNQQQFRAATFLRDVREVGIAFLLTPIFIFFGLRQQDWTQYLIAFACFGVGTYMVIDRWFQKKKTPDVHDSLEGCIKTSLAEVSHQIWLLKNIFWWYLLPFVVSLEINVIRAMLHSPHSGLLAELRSVRTPIAVMYVLLFWGLYHLNQFAVRKKLEPRQQELKSLLASLE